MVTMLRNKKEEWYYDTEAWMVHAPLAVTFR
jgi:hypothetical protein